MSRDLERARIAAHLVLIWDKALDGPLAIPNQPFTTPSNSPYGIVNIVERGTFRKSLGLNTFFKRHENTLQIDIYSPADTGTKRSRVLADRLEAIYQDLILPLADGENIVFRTPTARVLALNEQRASNLEDNWDRYIVEAPYYRDQYVEK